MKFRTWSKASDTNGLQSLMKLLGWRKENMVEQRRNCSLSINAPDCETILCVYYPQVVVSSSQSLLNLGGVLPPPSLRRKNNKICGENRGRLGDSYEKEE